MDEAIVAQADELRDGDMREVTVGDTAVLLARAAGQFYALGATCPHNGAALAKGVLHGTRIVCPWHHACFDATTGALEEPPALDGLSRYGVRQDGQNVIVSTATKSENKLPQISRRDPDDSRVFVVVGGGAAGYEALETLRREGYTGRLVLVTADTHLPYDRTAMSKDYLTGKAKPEWIPLRPDEFYTQHAIEVIQKRVQRLDAATRTITFADGASLTYDAALLATGGLPQKLDVPGADLANVFSLRTRDDADHILAQVGTGKRAVVVGASFIGMEGAAGLTQRGAAVTVVAPEAVPFAPILGERVGRVFQAVHEEKGVRFRLGRKVARVEGRGVVEAVMLDDGERLPADLVLAGLGVSPATDFVVGLTLRDDGGVAVDAHLQATAGLWAAGDIAAFPEHISGETARIEHWRLAQQHGRVAALNMLGRAVPYEGVPYFWSGQFAQSLRYSGHVSRWDDIIYWGDPAQQQFIAFYVRDGRVVAAAGSGHDTEIAAVEELLRANRMPTPATLRATTPDLVALLHG